MKMNKKGFYNIMYYPEKTLLMKKSDAHLSLKLLSDHIKLEYKTFTTFYEDDINTQEQNNNSGHKL